MSTQRRASPGRGRPPTPGAAAPGAWPRPPGRRRHRPTAPPGAGRRCGSGLRSRSRRRRRPSPGRWRGYWPCGLSGPSRDYRDEQTQKGRPKNADLTQSIALLARAQLAALWRGSAETFLQPGAAVAWEVWVRTGQEEVFRGGGGGPSCGRRSTELPGGQRAAAHRHGSAASRAGIRVARRLVRRQACNHGRVLRQFARRRAAGLVGRTAGPDAGQRSA